jgi:hypothetical protein
VSKHDRADTTEPATRGFGPGAPALSPSDGWIGTRELPGYRAGNVIAKLEELPAAGEDHLYFDLLLLDAFGNTEDNQSGRCYAMGPHPSLDERSRFVLVVAELLRHVSHEPHGLSSLGRALLFIREHGVGPGKLSAAAQLVDDACSARTVIASLHHVLRLSLGEEDAHLAMCSVVDKLARTTGFDEFELAQDNTLAATRAFQRRVTGINDGGLIHQVAFVVRAVGKGRARRYLRDATDFEMLPSPEMFRV